MTAEQGGDTAIRSDVVRLSAPDFGGRKLGETGATEAAEYIASRLAEGGVHPFVDGYETTTEEPGNRYWWRFEATASEVRTASMVLNTNGRDPMPSLALGQDYRVILASVARLSDLSVVFAGFGVRDSGRDHDDLAGIDVNGRVVLVLNDPKTAKVDGDFFLDSAVRARYFGAIGEFGRMMALKAAGARAILMVDDPIGGTLQREPGPKADGPVRWALATGPRPFFPERMVGIPVLEVSRGVADAILGDKVVLNRLATQLHAGDVVSRVVAARVSLSIDVGDRNVTGINVIGVVGSAVTKGSEVVVIGAHYDHLGQATGVRWPGADDNASGVSCVLEVARTLERQHTTGVRPVIVALWSGEEEGLLGSRAFIQRLQQSGIRVVAALNVDMVGRPQRDQSNQPSVVLALSPQDDFTAALRPVVKSTSTLAVTYRDQREVASDNLSFNANGIPTAAVYEGWKPGDYHQPTDTSDKIDYEYVQLVADFAAKLTERLARPQW